MKSKINEVDFLPLEIPEIKKFGMVTVELSEYSEMIKENFLAKKILEVLYSKSILDTEKTALIFDGYEIKKALELLDTENYNRVLEAKKQEAESEDSNS